MAEHSLILPQTPICAKKEGSKEMQARSEKTGWMGDLLACWRELVFWLLLLPAFGALESIDLRRQIVGLIETCAFLVLAISSTGKLKSLGLEFASWSRVAQFDAIICAVVGLMAGGAIVAVASLADQPLGVENGWNKAVLAVSIGPILEEVIFRGYLFAAAVLLTSRMPVARSAGVSIFGIAAVFSIAHLSTPSITALQLCCIGLTGAMYGYIRFRFQSTAAAALAHGMYNLALYLSHWSGVWR